ncbi:Asparagine synthase glutamine-hydrolyzing [Penicillium atrosanguineum]|uniref:Asparagine synthase glutamine-hydrolyzing n=1 Tax=Penicillium atrosanguineum TaxID=1132637 RepID=UPI00238D382C|nr:Asparagine synthase glutamine-hydrolyzing [Penicillium atrosanguineum]KAJ5304793.1 Asparagine synthase glutamine-hydrolyzing [Penicillium atrosanguineum]
MSRTVDLGRCLFYASDSPLQLQLSAIAHFIHSSKIMSIELPVNALQWPDQPSIWIAEAPELEIRLSIGMHTCLELATSALICNLSEMLCNSKVWSDLGFAIVLKGHGDNTNTDLIRAHYITFGLCRIPITSNITKGRALPVVLLNPPDPHVPPCVPTISLATIDIYAEYKYPQGKQNIHRRTHPHVEHMSQLEWLFPSAECYYPMHPEKFEEAACSLSSREPGKAFVRQNTLFPNDGVRSPSPQHESIDNLAEAMLRLIDFGLRKLIISSTARDRQIKLGDKNTLVSLSDLAPAVFNPDYREAIHQRAASISIISKAMTSMLLSSMNPIIQSKLSSMLQQSNDFNEKTVPPEPRVPSLKSTIHSSLWRIAQRRTRRPKAYEECRPFFTPEPNLPQHYPDAATSMDFGESTLPHSDPLDLDNSNLNTTEQDHMEYFLENDTLLLKTSSESSFEGLDESTPATQNDNSERCEPYLLEYRDTDMLFLDHEIIDTCE